MTGKRILVVDDALVDRMKLLLVVRGLGHPVSEAKNGREALQAIGAETFDLILLDLLMPEMDGFETLENMPRFNDKLVVPTVVVSSLDDPDELQRAIDLGAAGHLCKPFTPDQVLSALRHAR